jgi:hypothetical protein
MITWAGTERRAAGTGAEPMEVGVMQLFRSRRFLVFLVVFAVAAAAAAIAVAAVTSQQVITDTTNVHLRVQRTTAEGFDSGWHIHPGLTVVQVQAGSLQITQGSCTPKTVNPGDTFIEVPFTPVRATGSATWTTTFLVHYEEPVLTAVTSPCP